MIKTYWSLLGVSVFAFAVSLCVFVLCGVFARKFFQSKKGIFILVFLLLFSVFFASISARLVIRCLKDLNYVIKGSYVEAEGEVVEYTRSYRDYDGNGKMNYSHPKFYFKESNEYKVLYAKNVEIGGVYCIRYYPNTQICEVLQKIN